MNNHVRRGIIETRGVVENFIPLPNVEAPNLPEGAKKFIRLVATFNPPKIDLTYTGQTGYLDYLRPDDLEARVSYGWDVAGRCFVALRVEVGGHPVVWVVHERYMDDHSLWVVAGQESPFGALGKEDWEFLVELCKTGSATLPEGQYFMPWNTANLK